MSTREDEPPALVVHRALEIVARQLFRFFHGKAQIDELKSLGAPGVADVLARWDGRGRLEPFAMQRLRWTILRELRRQVRRDRRAGFRDGVAALFAAEDAARGLEERPETGDVPEGSFVESFAEQVAAGFTVELSASEAEHVSDPDQDVERDAERMLVRRTVELLPAPLAELIDGYYYRGETVDELAAAFGMKRATVFDRLDRARSLLQQALAPAAEDAAVIPLRPAAGGPPKKT